MKEIKLSSYLNKVGLAETNLMDLSPVARLNTLYTAHLLTFSYSNVKLRQASWEHPLKRKLRFEDYKNVFFEPVGGYCFQLAALLKDVLIKLEYTVDVCEARVLMGAEVNAKEILQLPPTHLVLKVTIGEQSYFLDPGLGNQSPRLPILVTGRDESVIQPPDEFRFYYLEQEKLYVLERMTEKGWLRLIQTDLCPLKQAKIEFNLMQLEQHVPTLGIRDEKFVMGRVLPQGRCSLFWLASSKQLKYIEKTTTENKEEILTDYDRAAQLVQDKFNIQTTSKELEKCCTSNKNKRGFLFFDHKPRHRWTVEFPLNERTISSMQSNLV
ncbi:putative N-hydroxyarylamine O-acetyltransferase [Legionella lansingensis]|uniref:Putative N-hydroxyarylamine O-acetyltransferase n=1 Tax=Legionella lansingensis TaxID=45067 RepID=A0A0W0VF05_9GAMM|nr:arylamine N-acetyltransferase [Legionella lansingensis]KTD18687.1 putative N-hydroxyarylamine O-acetyltransferase [Legionella lansingensis]SNV57314.1 putative N-hydroxyarylamine O-acetyltransferase [Legionella lansingensis]